MNESLSHHVNRSLYRQDDPAAPNAMSVFHTNPLEVFEIEARVSRYYDHWVSMSIHYVRHLAKTSWSSSTYVAAF